MQKDTEVNSRRGRRRDEDQLLFEGEPVSRLSEGFDEGTLETQISWTAQKQRLRKSKDLDDHTGQRS